MWKVAGNIYRVLESVCREQRDGYIKCPGCSGSGISLDVRNSDKENRHSLIGQPCRFCEGHGVLPLTGLRGFVLVRPASNFQTEDIATILGAEGYSLKAPFSNSCTHKKNHRTSIEFTSCLKIDEYLVNSFKSPPWFADINKWIMKTSLCSPTVDDAMPQILHPNLTKSSKDILFKSFRDCTPLFSVGLLISLLASALSSHSADVHDISSEGSLDNKGTEKRDNGSQKSESVVQIGKELGDCSMFRRNSKKRRNSLREKAAEAANAREKQILLALVSRGAKS